MQQTSQKQFKVTEDIVAKMEQRFINWLLDIVVQTLIFIVLFGIVSSISISHGNKELPHYLLYNGIGQYTAVSVISLVYYISMETLFSRTLGKLVTQTIVVNENGERPSHSVVLTRTLCRLVPMYGIFFLFSPQRGLHDLISNTYVVDKNKLDERKRQFYSLK